MSIRNQLINVIQRFWALVFDMFLQGFADPWKLFCLSLFSLSYPHVEYFGSGFDNAAGSGSGGLGRSFWWGISIGGYRQLVRGWGVDGPEIPRAFLSFCAALLLGT